MNVHLSRLLRCFAVAIVLVLCTSSSFLGYAQQPEISVGETVRVVTDGTRLNLREKPGLSPETTIGKLEKGDTMRVIGGPRYADGYEWWELEGEAEKLEGKERFHTTGWAAGKFLRVIEPAKGTKNIARKFHQIAPTAKVIGFKGDVEVERASDWSKWFWTYAIAGEEFGRAATKAAHKSEIKKDWLAVYGNQDVYLHSLQKKWVDIYGFTDCATWGPHPFDKVNTLGDMEYGSQKLIEAGYVPRLHPNKLPEHAITTLRTAEVFFFHGHGCEPSGIAFHDDKCTWSCIWPKGSEEEELPSELPDLKLVVLLACRGAEEDPSKESDEKVRSKPIEEKAEKFWYDLERRIADWWFSWQEELGKKVADLQEELEKKVREELLRQLCGAPAGLVIVSSHQFWRWRKRSKGLS